MKSVRKILAAALAFTVIFTASARSFAANNSYESSFSFDTEKGSFNAKMSLSSNGTEDWNLETVKVNDQYADGYAWIELKAHAEVGDTITGTVSSDTSGAYLGVTVMPQKEGKWEDGKQYTATVGEEEVVKSQEYVIEEGVSRVQVTLCEYPDMFAAKKPGSAQIVLNIYVGDTPMESSGHLGRNIIILLAATFVALLIAGAAKKVIRAHKNKKETEGKR